jgi:hypothetical protein
MYKFNWGRDRQGLCYDFMFLATREQIEELTDSTVRFPGSHNSPPVQGKVEEKHLTLITENQADIDLFLNSGFHFLTNPISCIVKEEPKEDPVEEEPEEEKKEDE